MAHLQNNLAAPFHGFAGGGAFAQPPIQGNTQQNMFAPGPDPIVPDTYLTNPFSNAMHVRREVPDSATMVNLPEVVIFLMTSDGQNFMLDAVLPVVRWGWALRTITQRGLIFPQMPILETPETAPYRTSIFGGFIETTNFTRFSGGTQYSMEYYKTAQGKNHQSYDLYRLSLSVSEMLNDKCYRALLGCKRQVAARFASTGEYRSIDVRRALQQDVLHWAWVIKEDYGFQKLFEDVRRLVAKFQGSITAAIMPSIVNSLILARPELLHYYLAGPSGPGRVTDQNRSLIPEGQITIFTPRHTPERVGATVPPTMGGSQIGNYHKSLELPELRSTSDEYLKTYSSDCRAIGIYCQERDRIVWIAAMELLDNCNLFTRNGKIKSYAPKGSGEPRDFLTLTQEEVDGRYRPDPPEFPKISSSTKQRPSSSANKRRNPKGGPIKTFGQLRISGSGGGGRFQLGGGGGGEGFTIADRSETGRMILFRLDEHFPGMSRAVSAGLDLYKRMCEATPDLEFVDYVVRCNVATQYKKRWSSAEDGKIALQKEGDLDFPPSHPRSLGLLVDKEATTNEILMQRAHEALAEFDEDAGYAILTGGETGFSCLPLPTKRRKEHDEYFGKDHKFSNLTGYASYEGFRAMAKLWASDPSSAENEYDADILKTAFNFVTALENASGHLEEMLPGFAEKEVKIGRGESVARMVAERGLGMCTIPLWVNSKKVESVVIPGPREKMNFKPMDLELGERDLDVAGLARLVGESSATLLGRFFSKNAESDSPSLLEDFVRIVGERMKRVKGSDPKDLARQLSFLRDYVNFPHEYSESQARDFDVQTMGSLYRTGGFGSGDERARLGISRNPFWNLVVLWSPLRLAVFGAVLELAISAAFEVDDKKFFDEYRKLMGLLDVENEAGQHAATLAVAELNRLYKGVNKFKPFAAQLTKAKQADTAFWNGIRYSDETKRSEGPFTTPSYLLKEITGQDFTLDVLGDAKIIPGVARLLNQQDRAILKLAGYDGKSGNINQLPVGGRSKFRFKEDDPSANILGEYGTFWKTGLSVSADQLDALFSMNKASDSASMFDVRIGDLKRPNRHVPYDRQPALLKEMQSVQNEFAAYVSRRKQVPDGSYHTGNAIKWIDVPLLQARRRLHHTFVGPSNREGADEFDQVAGLQSDLIYTEEFMRALAGVDAISPDPWTRCLAALWSITPFTRASCAAAIKSNVRLPFNFLVFRPHMNYLFHHCFFVNPGVENLGFTAIAGEDVMEGGTHITKEGGLHASFWHAVHVSHPENEHTVYNFAPAGFGPGGSTGWIDPATYDPASFGDYEEPTTPGSPSMICVPIPFSENPTRDYISITGHMAVFEMEDSSGLHVSDEDRRDHYSTWERANDTFKFLEHGGLRYMDTMGPSGMYPKQNSLCWAGMTHYKAPGARDVIYMTANKNHWGINQGPGCAPIYRGVLTTKLPDYGYNTDAKYVLVA